MSEAREVTSFLSFDVEALPGRATERLVERLVWGEIDGEDFGIRRISKILRAHKVIGNFLIDFGMCLLYGDKVVRRIVDFLLAEGHEVHAHLHSEWVVRKWGVNGPWSGPLGLDRTDQRLSEALLQFTAWKYHELTGQEPCVFRSGAYLFSDRTIAAAKTSGFQVLSNYNSLRHPQFDLPEAARNNAPFSWTNQLLELPVDFSPEPLSYDWTKYVGWYERARTRKLEKTFNLVLHSWSLLKRNSEVFDEVAPEHEERLHRICEHLDQHTRPLGYTRFLAEREPTWQPPVEFTSCSVNAVQPDTPLTTCGICGFGFTDLPATDVCPGCGARARHRQLHDALSRLGPIFDGKVVLANYANAVERRAFLSRARSVLNFDVRPVSEVELRMDVQDMSMVRTASIDVFFALHVLNHVREDERALREIARVLKPGGLACLTIPYREGAPTAPSEDITEHYGQEALDAYGVGSYRRYGLDDAIALFGRYFEVSHEDGHDSVMRQSMRVFVLRKPRSGSEERPRPEVGRCE